LILNPAASFQSEEFFDGRHSGYTSCTMDAFVMLAEYCRDILSVAMTKKGACIFDEDEDENESRGGSFVRFRSK